MRVLTLLIGEDIDNTLFRSKSISFVGPSPVTRGDTGH